MARRLILIVCSDNHRLQAWDIVVRHAGYRGWPVSTLHRARGLVRNIRPALVLMDAELSDGRASVFLPQMRALASLAEVPVLILGVLTPEEQALVERDTYVHLQQVDDADGDTLSALLEGVLAGSPSGASEWSKPDTESGEARSRPLWTPPPRAG